MLATEHERNTRAVLNQDIYENDAELDCNMLSTYLSDQKKERAGADELPSSGTAGVEPAANPSRSGDAELDNLLAVTQIECSYSADPPHRAAPGTNDQKSVTQ